jgi:methylated-DNA-protein-cysteine methyltransferase related protein
MPKQTKKQPNNDSVNTYEKIYNIVREIPYGKLATYGQIADLSGLYGKARLVGYALFQVDVTSDIPWQRVINAKGEISYSPARCGADRLQKNLLQKEGIEFDCRDRIDLKKYRWQPTAEIELWLEE